MQEEAVEIWREIERETGKEILTKGGLLYMKKPDSWEFKELMKYGEVMTAAQINEKWPAMRVPPYLNGVFSKEAGVVKVKEALMLTQ